MGDSMFRDVGGRSGDGAAGRKYTVLLSIVTHALVAAAAVVVPIVATATDLLPPPSAMIAFTSPPPPPPAPPPRAIVSAPRPAAPTPPPIEAPAKIVTDIEIPSDKDPVAEVEPSLGLVTGTEYTAWLPQASPLPRASVPDQPPVRPGGNVRPPLKIKDVAPVYPRIAQLSQVQGLVLIEATIGPDGDVRDAKVLRSVPLLDAAALDAVRQWRYTPTLLNGKPVAVVMTVTVIFQLR